jgi:hypothetical protein
VAFPLVYDRRGRRPISRCTTVDGFAGARSSATDPAWRPFFVGNGACRSAFHRTVEHDLEWFHDDRFRRHSVEGNGHGAIVARAPTLTDSVPSVERAGLSSRQFMETTYEQAKERPHWVPQ